MIELLRSESELRDRAYRLGARSLSVRGNRAMLAEVIRLIEDGHDPALAERAVLAERDPGLLTTDEQAALAEALGESAGPVESRESYVGVIRDVTGGFEGAILESDEHDDLAARLLRLKSQIAELQRAGADPDELAALSDQLDEIARKLDADEAEDADADEPAASESARPRVRRTVTEIRNVGGAAPRRWNPNVVTRIEESASRARPLFTRTP